MKDQNKRRLQRAGVGILAAGAGIKGGRALGKITKKGPQAKAVKAFQSSSAYKKALGDVATQESIIAKTNPRLKDALGDRHNIYRLSDIRLNNHQAQSQRAKILADLQAQTKQVKMDAGAKHVDRLTNIGAGAGLLAGMGGYEAVRRKKKG